MTRIVRVAVVQLTCRQDVAENLDACAVAEAEAAADARILTVHSAFTAHTGKDHWHVLVRARGVENQCFVLAPNQFGAHAEPIPGAPRATLPSPPPDVTSRPGAGPARPPPRRSFTPALSEL